MVPLTNKRAIQKLRKAVQAYDVNDAHNTISERFYHFKKLVEIGGVHTLEPLLPLCLSLNGKPYELTDHFAFSPFYKTRMPSQMVVVSGRQVAKSSNLAAHGVILSNAIPFLRTLYITPLYEQIRRFSNNYVSSFINQSPVKSLWTGTSTKNSVLSKTFRNNSSMTFSFTGTDCDRIRGISADSISLDESVRVGTMISGPGGSRPIETLKLGDQIHAFDENGYIKEDKVLTCSDHGVRDCFRIEFADGSSVEATSDSFIATTAGWKRVATIIADWVADTDAARDHAGRWEHVSEEQKPSVQESTQLQAARVQLGEVPGIVRVRTHTSQESEELRLRRLVKSMGNTNSTSPLAYCGLVSPRRQKVSNTEVARSADLGGGRLVVPRRRQPQQRSQHNLPHSGLLQTGGRIVGFLADAEWYSSKSITGEESTQVRSHILGNQSQCGCDLCVGGKDTAIHSSVNAVQDRSAGTSGIDYVCNLRGGVPSIVQPQCEVQLGRKSGVSSKILQTEKPPNELRKESHTRTPYYSQPEAPRCVHSRRQRTESKMRRTYSTVSSTTSGSGCSIQKEMSRQTTGTATTKRMDVSAVPVARTKGNQRCKNEILPSVPSDSDERDQGQESVPLGASEIVSITWTGKHRVFDISTAKYRTFFAGGVAVHNCQDLDSDHFPIIRETMSHSKWSLTKFTGTPKTLDNTIHGLWKRSSQAEWFIPCSYGPCGEWNIPSLESHLEAMLGPLRYDISEEFPGTVCHKCRRPIRPREGHWVHRFPDRRWDFAGYHVPQVIMPLHYSSYKKWDELLAKQRGWGNYTQARFYNEVLGESVDAGQQLVSETELRRAGSLPWKNNPNQPDPEVMRRLPHYTTRVLAVDWGGGGAAGVSFTTMALLGFAPDGKIHCLWGKRLVASQEHLREARELLHWTRVFSPDFIVHDYTGAGVVREGILVQAGFDLNRVMPIEYIRAGVGNMLRYIEPSVLHNRGRYRLDKTRSLLWTCQAIKLDMLRFFEYDYVNDDNAGLMHDFLALVEEKTETRMAGDIYTIVRNQMLSDDYAQAVNIGCCALWHINQSWPNFAQAAAVGQI